LFRTSEELRNDFDKSGDIDIEAFFGEL